MINSSTALAIFLGELRQGADVEQAAVVAEMTREEGERHAAAERRGEYAHVEAVRPNWSIDGDVLTLRSGDGEGFALTVQWETSH